LPAPWRCARGWNRDSLAAGTAIRLRVGGSARVNMNLPVVHPRMGTGFDAAGASPLLEPPGFLLLNYGRATPLVTVAAHVAYGALVGGFVSLAV
jgi:hypothetical protein